MRTKKGKALLMVVAGTLAVATSGCPRGFELPDGGGLCFCGNAAPACFFEDGGVCAGGGGEPLNQPQDGGTDAGQDAGP